MFVRIRRLRRAGRRIPEHEAALPENLAVGDLRSTGNRFELHSPLTNVTPSDVLFDARVIGVHAGVGGMLVRGFEERHEAAVLQEWEVTPLEHIVDQDGLSRWNWSR
jgi:hypothetical protein